MSKKEVLKIFKSSVDAVLPKNALNDSLYIENKKLCIKKEKFNLSEYKNIYVFGVGKASVDMAKQTEKILGKWLTGGFVVGTKESKLKKIESFISDHPIPTKRSIEGGKRLKEELSKVKKDDFFIFLLSGGASSLVEIPKEGLNLSDIKETTKTLLASGGDITEVNMIRKTLSDLKGGELAKGVKGKGIVLGISDVVTGEIEAIGSAPMYTKKLPTKRDIDLIVSHYKLDKKLSKKVLQTIQNYTPRKKKKEFPHFIISDNEIALKAGKKQATKLGYKTTIAPFLLGGEAKIMAKKISRYSQSLKKRSSKSSLCILIGGETTVTLKGDGKGGRNQEFVLAMMKELKDCSKISYFSGGTDGIDGNSPYAGAYGSVRGYKKSVKQGLNLKKYLSNNDSSSFFEKIDGVVKTGYTGTNVADIAILLIEK